MQEPFALELHRRFERGASAEQLAAELEIPVDRIKMRLRVAAIYLKMQQEKSASATPALVHS